MKNLQILLLVDDVHLVDFHDEMNGDLNDNPEFCKKIEELERISLSYRTEEYYDTWMEVYRLPNNEWAMYFTEPTTRYVNAYIIRSSSFISLWKFVGAIRNQSLTEYPLKNKVDETIQFFLENNQKGA